MSIKLIPGVGPSHSPLCFVGEAPGKDEMAYGQPFIGEAGQELNRILKDSGLKPLYQFNRETRKQEWNHYATNVFKSRPTEDSNDVNLFFTGRTDPAASLQYPPRNRKYLRSEFLPMVDQLVPELVGVGARVVVALGGTALWALLGHSKISDFVGTIHAPTQNRPFWVLPTYHPAAVLRQWNFRSVMVANLGKVPATLKQAGASSRSVANGNQPLFQITTNPSLDQVRAFSKKAVLAPAMAVDIETAHGQIRTISFSLGPKQAFVIPFWEPPQPSYWPTAEGECEALACVRRALSGPGTKIFQNGQYDIQYLWRVYGIPISGPIFDTMLAHHSLEPELKKSLGFLAATYLNIPEWKTMRVKSEKDGEDE